MSVVSLFRLICHLFATKYPGAPYTSPFQQRIWRQDGLSHVCPVGGVLWNLFETQLWGAKESWVDAICADWTHKSCSKITVKLDMFWLTSGKWYIYVDINMMPAINFRGKKFAKILNI